jgi:type IX secretion system PorP/SprF family membrane protein
MKGLYILLCTVLLNVVVQSLHAQDLHFSQFTSNPLALNPAVSGSTLTREISFSHRNQWSSISNPFKTFAVGASTRFGDIDKQKRGFWGAGLLAYSDKAGDGNLTTNAVLMNLAYHVRLSRYEHLGFGLQSGYVSRYVDLSKFQWASQYDGTAFNSTLPTGENGYVQSFGYMDLNAGVVYTLNNTAAEVNVENNNYRQVTAGVAFQHLTMPAYAFGTRTIEDHLYVKMTMFGNALWSIPNSSLAINPSFMFVKQGPHELLNFGALARLSIKGNSKYTALIKSYAMYGGIHYRVHDAVILTGMLEYGNYQFGMSYDFNVSKLASASSGRGAIEFNLRYVMSGTKARIMTSGL